MLTKIYTITALEMLSIGLIMPSFGPYLLSLGSSNITIGLLGSICALAQLVSNPLAGSLSDKKGRRNIILKTQTLVVFSNFLLAIFYQSVTGIFLSRILNALGSQSIIILKALVADVTNKQEQTSIYGKIGGCMAFGFVFGPIIGGILSSTPNGFRNLSLVLTLISIINLTISTTLPEPGKTTTTTSKPETTTATNELTKTIADLKRLDWSKYGDIFTYKFLADASLHTCMSSLGLVLTETFGVPQHTVGVSVSTMGVSMVVFNATSAKIKSLFYPTDTHGRTRTLHGSLLYATSFLGLLVAPTYWMYVPWLVPMVASKTVLDLTWTEALVERCGEEEKGVVMGSFESVMHLAGLAVPLVSGVLLEVFGPRGPAVACLVPAFVGVVIA